MRFSYYTLPGQSGPERFNTKWEVLRMATVLYGKYMLISRPHYDEKLRVWFPYASTSWYGDTFHYQQFKDFEKSFQTEEQALAFGFVAARNWIEEHESD